MVQVIQLHPYESSYPFGLEKQTEFTYVQMAKQTHSPQQLQSCRHNLTLFQSFKSQLLIQMDSYVQQDNRFLIYYQYEPISIKTFIEHKLNQYTNQTERDNFLNKIITNINQSIDNVINFLSQKNIQAILAIDNIAINNKFQIKFFIQPDFDHLKNPKANEIHEYYLTEKKKLQIQLEQFLEHIFSSTNIKSTQFKKANFIIQGNKLVFITNQEQIRQSSTGNIFSIGQNIKNKQKNTTLSSQANSHNNSKNSIKQHDNSKHKFDIKNILDQKKLQKNQILSMLQNDNNPKKQQKYLQNDKRQVKNYFQNNDDFNKDASFYPEQFIKDDSIAQFQGYEDELEKELEDLKKKKYEEDQSNKNKQMNALNSPTGVQLLQQKMNKFSGYSEISSQQKTQGLQMKSLKYPNNNQKDLNTSKNHENDTSTEQRQKKKYKVTITTSHQVDVEEGENINLKQIEKQLIQDIKKGRLQGCDKNPYTTPTQPAKPHFDKDQFLHKNLPPHVIKGRQTHNPSSSHQISINPANFQQRNTSLNSLGSNMSSSVDQKGNDEKPFSKHHHILTQGGVHFQSGKQIKIDSSESVNQAPYHGHDINKILQKIKTNMNSQQNHSHNQQNQQSVPSTHQHLQNFASLSSKQLENNHISSIVASNIYSKPKSSVLQEDSHSHNYFSKDVQSGENKLQQQQYHDKQYNDKIQKAKIKAEQIMKLVKQRKAH